MKREGNDEAIPSTTAMPGCSPSLAIEPARTIDAPKQSEEEREWRSGNANGRAMRARRRSGAIGCGAAGRHGGA
ncbi:hypothetical protein WT37_11430 [Burkholderia territorii]|nr:hypothetical protein WT37_11430 [Burkholderia territorii]